MKMGTEFWVDHVAAATLETISASEYARRHGISPYGILEHMINPWLLDSRLRGNDEFLEVLCAY